MNQSAYERAIVYARSFLAKNFTVIGEEKFCGKGNVMVECHDVIIPHAGSLAGDETLNNNGKEIPFAKITEQKFPPTDRRIFVIGISISVAHANGAKSGSYFLKVQFSNEEKASPVTVVIVGSKRPHTETERFQELLGDTSNLLLNYSWKELGRILRTAASVYGKSPYVRGKNWVESRFLKLRSTQLLLWIDKKKQMG